MRIAHFVKMTTVHGQIESLTRIKDTLRQEGIDKFSSISEIKRFTRNFDLEKQKIEEQTDQDYHLELKKLKLDAANLKSEYNDKLAYKTNKLDHKIEEFIDRRKCIETSDINDPAEKTFHWFYLLILSYIFGFLEP